MGDKLDTLKPHTVEFAMEFIDILSDHHSVGVKSAQVSPMS